MTNSQRRMEARTAYAAGLVLLEKGEYERASPLLSLAVQIQPEFAEAHEALGKLYWKRRDEHRSRVHDSFGKWLRQRATLEPFRVRPGDRRTTPQPSFDAGSLFPELSGRSLVTVRLNPRYGEEPPLTASKLGGTFLWPSSEPWPFCAIHGIPCVGVLQLRADDFPEMPFPQGADLFQMLWCPREHDAGDMSWADPKFFWRNAGEVRTPVENPSPQEAYYEYVPLPCCLMPERIIEYPSIDELPEDLQGRIHEWETENGERTESWDCSYEGELSVCPGTKIGGYLHVIQWWWTPTCSCGREMEHLLTVETVEWNGFTDRRWTPKEEQELFASLPGGEVRDDPGNAIRHALWIPTGLRLGDAGQMQLFLCRHCRNWPIVPAINSC